MRKLQLGRTRALLIAACCLAFASVVERARAQGQQPSLGTVAGFAVDSVRGGPLRGATVSILGTALSAVTDSSGQFRIDGVRAGPVSLVLAHPLIDTLGISIVSPSRELPAGEALAFALGIPSPLTIVSRKCSVEDMKRGSAALIGVVSDADSEFPSNGADVTIAWTDYTLSKKSINGIPQRRTGKAGIDGTYLICGIPDDLATGVFASRDADSTAAVTVDFGRKLAIQSFVLPSPVAVVAAGSDSAKGQQPRGHAVVSGKVLDPVGKPLAGARVSIEDDGVAAITRDDGTFMLRGARSGTRAISVRKIGFEPQEIAVTVSTRELTQVNLSLRKPVQTLETVRVTALREIGLQRVGFVERQKWGMGKMFSPADIERRNPLRLNYLLEAAPMLRSGRTADGKRYINGRGWQPCLRYYIDGRLTMEYGPTDLEMLPDSYLSTAEIGAVEVYDKMSVPGEFLATSRSGMICSVVLIWTKFKLGIR